MSIPNKRDAVALLKEDHKLVQKLFKDFEKLKQQENDTEAKMQLVTVICNELKIHTQIEEEIFYPAVRDAIDDDDLMDEAKVEHDSAKQTIEELESMQPADDLFDAKVTVLGEYVNHHVEEEQQNMFPKAKRAQLDLKSLGSELATRKQELKAEMGIAEEDALGTIPSRRRNAEGGKRTSR